MSSHIVLPAAQLLPVACSRRRAFRLSTQHRDRGLLSEIQWSTDCSNTKVEFELHVGNSLVGDYVAFWTPRHLHGCYLFLGYIREVFNCKVSWRQLKWWHVYKWQLHGTIRRSVLYLVPQESEWQGGATVQTARNPIEIDAEFFHRKYYNIT